MKVAVEPLASETGLLTASQELLPPSVVAVMVTFPLQLPVTPMVNVWVAGFVPTPAAKVNVEDEGAWSVQAGSTVKVTEVWITPTVAFVTLSTTVIVTVPVYVPALKPVRLACSFTLAVAGWVNEPEAAALNHVVPPVALVQVSGCRQSPPLLIVIARPTVPVCPAVPCRASVPGPETVQGSGLTINVTGTICGPVLTVKVSEPV